MCCWTAIFFSSRELDGLTTKNVKVLSAIHRTKSYAGRSEVLNCYCVGMMRCGDLETAEARKTAIKARP
jgi:hypothetical protein